MWGAFFNPAGPASAPSLDPHACLRPRHPVSALRAAVLGGRLQREWRLHDEVQPAIGTNQQRKILSRPGRIRPGYVEDLLRVLEEKIHYRAYRQLFKLLEGLT